VRSEPERITWLEEQLGALTARVHELENRRAAMVVTAAASPRSGSLVDGEAFEAKLGTYWLSRIGIVSLITGIALLVVTHFGELGPLLRVAVGYAIAAALGFAGLRIARRHETFGRVVFGGGLAVGYFVTYALHFVDAMRVLDSQAVGIALVAAAITAIVVIAHRMRSETVAGIALYLGLHTGLVTDVSALTLVCTTLLAAGAGFFLAANRWVIVPFSTVIAVYTTHAVLAFGHGELAPSVSVGFLAVDFTLFAVASLVGAATRSRWLIGFAALNWAGVIALGARALAPLPHPALFEFLVGFAVAHVVLAGAARLRRSPVAVAACQLALAIGTLSLALPVELDHEQRIAGWGALAIISALLGRRAGWAAFRWAAVALIATMEIDSYFEPAALSLAVCVATLAFAVERVCAPREVRPAARVVAVALATASVLQLATTWPVVDRTVSWLGVAALVFAAGFALSAHAYRWAGFAVLGLTALHFFAIDLADLPADGRIATFIAGGVVLLAVSFAYTQRRTSRDDRAPADR
jgi:hypothetical protein